VSRRGKAGRRIDQKYFRRGDSDNPPVQPARNGRAWSPWLSQCDICGIWFSVRGPETRHGAPRQCQLCNHTSSDKSKIIRPRRREAPQV
jgi:hypothetical protein